MNSPFVYGRIAADASFTDRIEETAALVSDFKNLTNTILISPRRWGKSSLVRRAGALAQSEKKNLRICYIDIFNVRTEEEFYEKLAAEILRSTSSFLDEVVANAKRFLSRLIPVITAGDPINSVGISFKTQDVKMSADEILDLAENIAKEKNLELVICIDEFQQIANFGDSEAFQAKLRSHWQLHQRVAYCLYGSRRHMMIEVFTHREKPFYKFGKTIFLEKISPEKWPEFIMDRFRSTGKEISRTQCEWIVRKVDNNPYYIQQLSEEVWNRTDSICTDASLDQAFNAIVNMQAGLDLALTSTLTLSQQNLLHAIVDGNKELTSAAVMGKYGLKNSITVLRAKNALIKMDIIDNFGKEVTMEDPVYAYWLKNVYFG
ncbi:MAG: ATPase [Bacteroidales bacterium]|nr:ATPase [Bacteroidales bacterium]